MTSREAQPKNGRFASVMLYVGAAGTIIGVISGLFGLPKQLEDLFNTTESQASAVKLQHEKAALAEASPRLDVSYVFVDGDLVNEDTGSKRPTGPREAVTLRSYPIVRNEVFSNRARPRSTAACPVDPLSGGAIGFLVVNNRGQRDATGLTMKVRRLQLPRAVKFRDSLAGDNDYRPRLAAEARAVQSLTVHIPQTLGPGDGVRLPLFVADSSGDGHGRWCVVSRSAFAADSLSFTDPALVTTKTLRVRRMQSPIRLANGLVIRG